jgi:sterol desaturase/sphingolipid hydroxylase (fatty acid hydroxylase superfamily)
VLAQVLVGLAVATIIFVPLERLFALRRQRVLRDGWRTDLAHFLVTGRLVDLGLIVAIVIPVVVLRVAVVPFTAPVVTAQPWWLQLLEGILIGSIGAYIGHRLTHTVPFLWRFHRVHHSIEQMDWLAAPRLHPIDSVFTRSLAVLPLVALGFTRETFGAYLAFAGFLAIFIHSNVRIRYGPLRWVLGSPEWHHWHHAADAAALNRNFAAELPFLDVLFGTAYMPKGQRPTAYGLAASEPPITGGWFAHMAAPFRRRELAMAPSQAGMTDPPSTQST